MFKVKGVVVMMAVLSVVAIVGTAWAIDLPQTGQTTSYYTGDDGDIRAGVAWPSPRFTVGTGVEADCVTDNLTGLMWVRAPDSTLRTWQQALDYAKGLSLDFFSLEALISCNFTKAKEPDL